MHHEFQFRFLRCNSESFLQGMSELLVTGAGHSPSFHPIIEESLLPEVLPYFCCEPHLLILLLFITSSKCHLQTKEWP